MILTSGISCHITCTRKISLIAQRPLLTSISKLSHLSTQLKHLTGTKEVVGRYLAEFYLSLEIFNGTASQ